MDKLKLVKLHRLKMKRDEIKKIEINHVKKEEYEDAIKVRIQRVYLETLIDHFEMK